VCEVEWSWRGGGSGGCGYGVYGGVVPRLGQRRKEVGRRKENVAGGTDDKLY